MRDDVVNHILRHTPALGGSLDYQELVDRIVRIVRSPEFNQHDENLRELFGVLLRDYAGSTQTVPARAKDLDTVFVSLAQSTDKNRKFLMYICAISKDTIAATDGHRVHKATIPNGNFKPRTRYTCKHGKLEEISPETLGQIEYDRLIDFPPIDKVFPANFEYTDIKVSLANFVEAHMACGTPIYRFQHGDFKIVLNKQYVDEAFSWRNSMFLSFNGSLDPVVFSAGSRSAVVMPLRDSWTKK